MRTLIAAGLARRLTGVIAILVAAALGAALVVMCGALFVTGIRLTAQPERLGEAPLIMMGDPNYRMLDSVGRPTTDLRPFPERHRLDATAATSAARVAGVARALPVIFATVRATGTTSAVLTAQNWASAPAAGLFPGTDVAPDTVPTPGHGEVVLTPAAAQALGARAGATVRLVIGGTARTARVVGVTGGPALPATVFAPSGDLDPDATIDAIAIFPAPTADPAALAAGLRAAVPSAVVVTGAARGAAEDPAISASRTPTIVIGAVAAGLVVTVLATVVSGIVSLSVRRRMREISLLRTVGATGRQAAGLLVGEATVVGVLGALLGLAIGAPAAQGLYRVLIAAHVLPAEVRLEVGPIPFAVAVVLPVAVVRLSAWAAARPARRSRAIDALREADLPRARAGWLRTVAGIVFGLGAIALAIITATMSPTLVAATGGPAVLAGSISAALLAPAYLRLGATIATPLLGRGSARLALANVKGRAATLATITAATALVAGLGVGNLVSQQVQTRSAAAASVAAIRADGVMITPTGIDSATLTALGRLPQVAAASAYVASGGWIEQPHDSSHPSQPWPLRGVTGQAADSILSGRVIAGSFTDLTGDTIALPSTAATALQLGVGDRLSLRLGDGASARLRVVAVFVDRPGYESLVLPAALLAAHTTARAPTMALVTARPGVGQPALIAALHSAVQHDAAGLGAQVGGRTLLESTFRQGVDVNGLVNELMVAVVLGYAMIAVINTVVVSVMARRRELALLRLAGATRGQVIAIMIMETALAAVVGVVTGLIAACAGVLPTLAVVGGGVTHTGPVAVLIGTVVAVAVITMPITIAAGRRATADRPVDAVAVDG